MITAAIVRTLKARKQCSQTVLFAQVLATLTGNQANGNNHSIPTRPSSMPSALMPSPSMQSSLLSNWQPSPKDFADRLLSLCQKDYIRRVSTAQQEEPQYQYIP